MGTTGQTQTVFTSSSLPHRRQLSIVLAVLLALVASLLAVTAQASPAAAQTSPKLVTTNSSYSAGWLVRTDDGVESKQWVSADCRASLEGQGQTFDPVGWSAFGSLPPAATNLTCAAIGTLLSGGETPPTTLVTTNSTYPHGWVIVQEGRTETKQWLNSACRRQLEAAGNSFAITPYNQFGSLAPASPPLSCDEIEALVDGGGGPEPTNNFKVQNGQMLDPSGNPFEMVGLNAFGGAFLWTTWDAGIIRDKDIYLDEWNINTIRLNITCDENCDDSLDEIVNELGSNIEWVSAYGPEGWVLFDYEGTRYKWYIDEPCRDDLERLSDITFTDVNWGEVVQPVTLWPAQSSTTCSTRQDINDVIEAYAGTGTVIILESHGLYFPNAPTPAQVQEKVAFFTEMGDKYKDNPYVWFSLYNEPLNECNLTKHGARLVDDSGQPQTVAGVASRTWVNIHVPVIAALRATGAKNPIVAGASNYGQDRCDASGDFNYNQSSILTYGDELLDADPEKNVIFDMHIYSRWANSSAADLDNYFTALHNAGFTVMVGEIGGGCANNLYRTDLRAAQLFYDNVDSLTHPPIGLAAWSASTGYVLTDAEWGDASRIGESNVEFDPSRHLNNLTSNGRMFYDFANGTDSFPAGASLC